MHICYLPADKETCTGIHYEPEEEIASSTLRKENVKSEI